MPPHMGAAAAPSSTSRARRRVSYKEESDLDSGSDAPPRPARGSRRGGKKRAPSPDEDSSDAFEASDDKEEDEDDVEDEALVDEEGDQSSAEEEDAAPVRKRQRRQAGDSKAPQSGQKVVKLARAPGKPPPEDQISSTLMSFLGELQDEAKNSRTWFQQHKAVYQYAWDNLQAFTMAALPRLMDVDDTVPWLPARDMVYRIYRDIRFSKSQMPYKTNLCATFSRGGRKGEFAGYHVQFEPGNRSFAAGGRWCPNKYHLAAIRKHILDDTELGRRLKSVVSTPHFEAYFGKAAPPERTVKAARGKKTKGQKEPDGQQDEKKPKGPKDTIVTTRQSQATARNLFGFEDELKVAPKIDGVPNVKEHKDIAWLRLRSFLVKRDFTDEQVLQSDFIDRLVETFKVMEPLITTLNDMVYPPPTPPPSDGGSGPNGDEDEEDEEGEEEEEE